MNNLQIILLIGLILVGIYLFSKNGKYKQDQKYCCKDPTSNLCIPQLEPCTHGSCDTSRCAGPYPYCCDYDGTCIGSLIPCQTDCDPDQCQ